jgi:hypothetical protein
MDLYYRRRFIGENNSIEFGDVKPLLPDKPFMRDFEIALNGIDRFLRERFRLRLFEFFYPPAPVAETIEAFPGMDGAGKSSYTIEGIRFSKSRPFLSFLEDLYRYTEYRFRIKSALELKRGAPPIHEIWKELADSALDFEDRAPVPAAERGPPAGQKGPPAPAKPEEYNPSPPLPAAELSETVLERLRADSDAVRELLRPDAADPALPSARPEVCRASRAKPKKPAGAKPRPAAKSALRVFLESLDDAGRTALALIAGAPEKDADMTQSLAALARAADTMPELIVDRINAGFLEISGDLLVDTVDEMPSIQPEYREEVKKFLEEYEGSHSKTDQRRNP